MPTASAARPRCSARCWTRSASRRARPRIELNASTDNPLVFENGDVLSGGNFHGQPVAQALDFLAIGAHHAAGDRRAPGRAAGESRPVAGAAGVPDRRPRAVVGLHDGADHGRVAGGRVAHPGRCRPASGRSRPTPTRRTSCRWGWRAAFKARRILDNAAQVVGGRVAVRGPGARVPQAAARPDGGSASSTSGSAASGRPCRRWREDRPPAPDLERLARAIREGVFDPAALG